MSLSALNVYESSGRLQVHLALGAVSSYTGLQHNIRWTKSSLLQLPSMKTDQSTGALISVAVIGRYTDQRTVRGSPGVPFDWTNNIAAPQGPWILGRMGRALLKADSFWYCPQVWQTFHIFPAKLLIFNGLDYLQIVIRLYSRMYHWLHYLHILHLKVLDCPPNLTLRHYWSIHYTLITNKRHQTPNDDMLRSILSSFPVSSCFGTVWPADLRWRVELANNSQACQVVAARLQNWQFCRI